MPLPRPRQGEKHGAFVGRCMGSGVMQDEYTDRDQRLAVCESQWRKGPTEEKEAHLNIERRVIVTNDIELRIEDAEAESGGIGRLSGYAAVFNKLSEEMMGFREKIAPGAFSNVLATKPDVAALVNHDSSLLLGRTPKTLTLVEDDRGLAFSVLLPDTELGRSVKLHVQRGDMSGASFGFVTKRDRWQDEDGLRIRTLEEIGGLSDVSVATYPAYPDTKVAVRSLERWLEQQPRPLAVGLARKKIDLLEL